MATRMMKVFWLALLTTDGQTSENLVSHKVHGFTQVKNTHVVVVNRGSFTHGVWT